MLFSIFLISAAVLAYEIVLMRIFSITQWHHFAYMIISIALLGFGASGTFISLFRVRLKRHFLVSYRFFSCLFPLSIIVCYFLSQQNEFNPFEIVWDARQYFHLLEYYLILFIPFFLAATCIGLMFTQYTGKIGLVYCYNLIGSGVGAIGVIACLYFVHPVRILYIIVGVAFCGIGITFLNFRRKGREGTRSKKKKPRIFASFAALTYVFIVACLIFVAVKYDPLNFQNHLNISQYKGLSQARKFPEAKILTEAVSPLGVVHTVSSPIIRNAPGLSLNYTGDIPSQIALFIDSGNAGVITGAAELEKHLPGSPQGGNAHSPGSPQAESGLTGNTPLSSEENPPLAPPRRGIQPNPPIRGGLEFLDFLSSSLVYHVRPVSHILILGSGGGTDVVNALYHKATTVDAVELDPNIIQLVQERFRVFSADLYSRPNVRIINQEARDYIETTHSLYDSIQISLLDSFSASSAGVHALHENYLYTIEALKQYYSHLTPQGILSITRWVKFPPRDNIKLFATAVEALEKSGIEDVSQHLISVRSWATCTLLISKIPFTSEEINRVRTFCRERAFDTNYFPGITPEDVNLYNQIPSPEYSHAAQELLFGHREQFYTSYPYFVKPAQDESPYFFHFFKWKTLPTLLQTMGKEWIPFIEWGYLVLLATLLQAGVISIILIIIPLAALPRKLTRFFDGNRAMHLGRAWHVYTLIYFICLGLGYLFLEMVFIQKFTLFLANPIYAVSVIIASFLISSGFGSLYFESRKSKVKSRTVAPRKSQSTTQCPLEGGKGMLPLEGSRGVFLPVGGIIGLSLVYLLSLPVIFSYCSGWSNPSRILITVMLIAPLGFCMGIPFPFGMSQLNTWASQLVPWAYGINGCASVLSSLIATCIAISWGFPTVILLAMLLYAIAAGTVYVISKSL